MTLERRERVAGMHWYAELRRYALARVPTFAPPADCGDLRVVHTLYLVALLSVLDLAIELFGREPVEADWHLALDGVGGRAGDANAAYLRELRNGVMHRGLDLSSRGLVIAGQVCVVAPPTVRQRRADRPALEGFRVLLRNAFADCEDALAKVLADRMAAVEAELAEQDAAGYLADVSASTEKEGWIPAWVRSIEIPAEVLKSIPRGDPEVVRRKFGEGAPAWLRLPEPQLK